MTDLAFRMQDPDETRRFSEELVAAGLLVPMGVQGLYGRGAAFERVALGVDALVARTHLGRPGEEIHFPPLLPRTALHRAGYLERFPHLCGSVHGFDGDEAAHAALKVRLERGEDYGDLLASAEVSLIPAACYPLYPTLTGTLPEDGRGFELCTWVYRCEPSQDPARMQAFRQREKVRLGRPAQVVEWRSAWQERGLVLLRALGLEAELVEAHDPFFGRGGRFLRADQLEQRLKFEVLVPIGGATRATAVASFNYHEDSFGRGFAIELPDGSSAHSACLGFGLERVALALFWAHGVDPSRWPTSVRRALWP